MASRRYPTETFLDRGATVSGYVFSGDQVGLVEENLRHEFRDVETRLTVRFRGNVRLTAVWPPEGVEPGSFFYLTSAGTSLQQPRDVASALPDIGIVPILNPIEHDETVLTPKYVRESVETRLASRHFRNQLLLLSDEQDELENLESFLEFAHPWVAELELKDVSTRIDVGGQHIDFYYIERGWRTEKEVFWAGDGMQVWLQLLFHIFRLRKADTIILDEPDVYLHPDLQRRLVQLLENLNAQTVTATHSPEVLAEAPLDAVVWVEKTRRRSVLTPDSAVLNDLVATIGTQFNIRLARALRAQTVLFVEGDDMKMMRHLARTVGADRVATEAGIAAIGLGGFANWNRIEPFGWLIEDLLEGSVGVFVILDRDYRSDRQCDTVKKKLKAIGATAHIWKRKELESYLLEPRTIARVCGIEVSELREILDDVALEFEERVRVRFVRECEQTAEAGQLREARRKARGEFNALWLSPERRLEVVPPKDVLSRLNQELEARKARTVSFRALARRMRDEEVADEVRRTLLRVQEDA